jgi:hypothetical protein
MAAEPTQETRNEPLRQLVEEIAKLLVEDPSQVSVEAIEDGDQTTVLELQVAPGDLGRVIGRQGRTARSIRAVLAAAGTKLNRRYELEILE